MYYKFVEGRTLVYCTVLSLRTQSKTAVVVEVCAVGDGGWSDNLRGKERVVDTDLLELVREPLDGNDEYAGFELRGDRVVYTEPEEVEGECVSE